MSKRLILLILLLTFSFAAVNVNAHHEPATNKDGSIVSNVLTASFDPFGQSSGRAVAPYPSNLGFFALDAEGNLMPPADLTLNTPVPDPNDFSNPRVALNALDGYSTTE